MMSLLGGASSTDDVIADVIASSTDDVIVVMS